MIVEIEIQKGHLQNKFSSLPAPSVMLIALTKSADIFPALRIPHLIVGPDSAMISRLYWTVCEVDSGYIIVGSFMIKEEFRKVTHDGWYQYRMTGCATVLYQVWVTVRIVQCHTESRSTVVTNTCHASVS